MSIWVDTDFGFDDLWALLLLRHFGAEIAGISLVAGNAPLTRVVANARGGALAYGLDAPCYAGADRPLVRAPETAERILGPRGMRSRGRHLPDAPATGPSPSSGAVSALAAWLTTATPNADRPVLALGPLTNIARLCRQAPEAAGRITRLVWMGGSDGPGNHTAHAEFNALADPEAAAMVAHWAATAGIPLDIVDLTLCRTVTFGPDDLPATDPLTADLLGGYLDIGLSRGRSAMAIYDPVAALAAVRPDAFAFRPVAMEVSTEPGKHYGQTRFRPDPAATTRIAVSVVPSAMTHCLDALTESPTHVS